MKMGTGFAVLILSTVLAGAGQREREEEQPVSSRDVEFMEAAARAGAGEVNVGHLASQKSQNKDVKALGEMMMSEHGSANDRLKNLANRKGVNLPGNADADSTELQNKLEKLEGAEFDLTYATATVEHHRRAIDLYNRGLQSQDNDIKEFALSTLSTLQQHLQHAERVKKSLSVDAK